MNTEKIQDRSGRRNEDQRLVLQCHAAESPQRLEHDCNHRRFNAVKYRLGLWERTIPDVKPCQKRNDERCRENETSPCEQKPKPSGSSPSDVECHLSGIRPWNQVRRAKQVEEFRRREPTAAPDHLIFHQCDVCSRSTETDHAELQKESRYFAGRCGTT